MVPKNSTKTGSTNRAKQRKINRMTIVESSPEKADVGGSIPSLATITSAIGFRLKQHPTAKTSVPGHHILEPPRS
jgi:hypothetical protein